MDFFVEVAVTGAVSGVGVDSSPEAVARVLGDDFVEDRGRERLRRDYGLVEFSWQRSSDAEEWQPGGFTVQAHRLDSRLPFAVLDAELRRLGYQLTEVDSGRYRLAESGVLLTVTAGEVWSINGTGPVDQVVRDGLAHLVRLPEAERAAWLDRRPPVLAESANWWLYLLLGVDQKLDRPEWVRLRYWLVEEARRRGVFSAADAAGKQAYFLLAMRRAGVTDPVLPSADVVVRDCLDAIPAELAEVATIDGPGDLHRLDVEQMRTSRRARILVTAASYHLEQLHDQQLAGRLRAWMDLGPHLV